MISLTLKCHCCFHNSYPFQANAGPSTGPALPAVGPTRWEQRWRIYYNHAVSPYSNDAWSWLWRCHCLNQLDNCRPNLNDKSMQDAIKGEMAVFERSGVRGHSLQLMYSHLLSIPPTTVEAERAFSWTGLLCTRIRSCLGDVTLDTLCFLRSNYSNNK